MPKRNGAEVRSVDLTYREALTIHTAIRERLNKAERALEKSTFVPEPGRKHMGRVTVERLTRMEEHLFAFLRTFPEFNPDEWED